MLKLRSQNEKLYRTVVTYLFRKKSPVPDKFHLTKKNEVL